MLYSSASNIVTLKNIEASRNDIDFRSGFDENKHVRELENSDDSSLDINFSMNCPTRKNDRRVIDYDSSESSSSGSGSASNLNLLTSFYQDEDPNDLESQSQHRDIFDLLPTTESYPVVDNLVDEFDGMKIENKIDKREFIKIDCNKETINLANSSLVDDATVILKKTNKEKNRRYIIEYSSCSSSSEGITIGNKSLLKQRKLNISHSEIGCPETDIISLENSKDIVDELSSVEVKISSFDSYSACSSTVVLKTGKNKILIELHEDDHSDLDTRSNKKEKSFPPKSQISEGWNYSDDKKSLLLSKEYIANTFGIPAQKTKNFQNICLPAAVYHRLYDHQKVGVQWLSSLHWAGIGGILGDDMGMVRS